MKCKILRFDDYCINTNIENTIDIASLARDYFEEIIFCISPLVHNTGNERVYPKIYNAMSDFRIFFNSENCGLPPIPTWVTPASHGLFHIDHRLLTKEVQEVSILASCSLSKSKIFVPPFNKWNKDTENICKNNGILLIKFEDGWKCAEYEPFDEKQDLWYIHAREWTLESFKKWLKL